MTLSRAIRFASERFDYASELPADYNAGNRYYGEDVAAFLIDKLAMRGLPADFIDEDWGWLVYALKESPTTFTIAIYNLSEHRGGGRRGVNRWGLWIREYRKTSLLGLFPKRKEVAVSEALAAAVAASVEVSGARVEPWQDGPRDSAA